MSCDHDFGNEEASDGEKCALCTIHELKAVLLRQKLRRTDYKLKNALGELKSYKHSYETLLKGLGMTPRRGTDPHRSAEHYRRRDERGAGQNCPALVVPERAGGVEKTAPRSRRGY